MDDEKELMTCPSCASERLIGFKLMSLWDGAFWYDIKCEDCSFTGSISEKDLEESRHRLWKIYGEGHGWKVGQPPIPVDALGGRAT